MQQSDHIRWDPSFAGSWNVIDFGLARRYVDEGGLVLPARPDAAFRGSTTYASLAAHDGEDLGEHWHAAMAPQGRAGCVYPAWLIALGEWGILSKRSGGRLRAPAWIVLHVSISKTQQAT